MKKLLATAIAILCLPLFAGTARATNYFGLFPCTLCGWPRHQLHIKPYNAFTPFVSGHMQAQGALCLTGPCSPFGCHAGGWGNRGGYPYPGFGYGGMPQGGFGCGGYGCGMTGCGAYPYNGPGYPYDVHGRKHNRRNRKNDYGYGCGDCGNSHGFGLPFGGWGEGCEGCGDAGHTQGVPVEGQIIGEHPTIQEPAQNQTPTQQTAPVNPVSYYPYYNMYYQPMFTYPWAYYGQAGYPGQ